MPAPRSKLVKTKFQSSIEILNSFLVLGCCLGSSDSGFSSSDLVSNGALSSLEETFTLSSKLLFLIVFSTFFLVSFTSPGKNETILNKAISKPLDKLGAISISRLAIKPI